MIFLTENLAKICTDLEIFGEFWTNWSGICCYARAKNIWEKNVLTFGSRTMKLKKLKCVTFGASKFERIFGFLKQRAYVGSKFCIQRCGFIRTFSNFLILQPVGLDVSVQETHNYFILSTFSFPAELFARGRELFMASIKKYSREIKLFPSLILYSNIHHVILWLRILAQKSAHLWMNAVPKTRRHILSFGPKTGGQKSVRKRSPIFRQFTLFNIWSNFLIILYTSFFTQ